MQSPTLKRGPTGRRRLGLYHGILRLGTSEGTDSPESGAAESGEERGKKSDKQGFQAWQRQIQLDLCYSSFLLYSDVRKTIALNIQQLYSSWERV